MPRKHLGPFYRPKPYFGSVSQQAKQGESAAHAPEPSGGVPHPGGLFSVAYATHRPCRCNSCICLTPEERAYERRVFRLAKAWSRMLAAEEKARKQPPH